MKKLYFIFALALFAFTGTKTFSQTDSLSFTTSGTFTVPAGITSLTITVVGAGGNGWLNGGGGVAYRRCGGTLAVHGATNHAAWPMARAGLCDC